MTDKLTGLPTAALAVPSELEDAARELYALAKAPATWTAYASDWRQFTAFCRAVGEASLPASPSVVVLWCVHRAKLGRAMSTIERSLAAIKQAHEAAGAPSPCTRPEVREALRGLRRQIGVRPQKRAPTLAEHVRKMALACPDSPRGLRDRAILLCGFAGAFRRSELVAVDVGDLTWQAEGVLVLVRRSKSDQEGRGLVKALPVAADARWCPVECLRRWLERSGVEHGAVFRAVDRWGNARGRMAAHEVAAVVQRYARSAGLDPKRVAAHSLRSGFVTQAARMAAPEYRIMEQTGHRSSASLQDYICEADRLGTSAAKGILDE